MQVFHPVLPLFVWEKARKTTKKQGLFIPTEPLKSLEKKGKTLKKTRNFSQGEKKEKKKIYIYIERESSSLFLGLIF